MANVSLRVCHAVANMMTYFVCQDALECTALYHWHDMIPVHIQMMEHKSVCGVLKQLQEEGALRGAEAKGVAATMCSVTTATKTCIRQLWQTITERTGPLGNRALLACNICVCFKEYSSIRLIRLCNSFLANAVQEFMIERQSAVHT